MTNNRKNPYLTASVLTPIGIIVILLFYYISSFELGGIIKNDLPSSSFFPFLIFVLGIIAASVLLIEAILEVKKDIKENKIVEQEIDETREKRDENGRIILDPKYKPFLITLLTVLFIVMFKYLGYVLTAPLYIFGFQVIYDDKLEKFGKKAIVALIVTLLVYVLYVGCFKILFPEVWS